MDELLLRKLQELSTQLDTVTQQLSAPDAFKDRERYKSLSQEHAELSRLLLLFNEHQQVTQALDDLQEMLHDPQYRDLALEESDALTHKKEELYQKIQLFLLPQDDLDHAHIFLEIRAGTGGQESSLFANDLFRMYARFAERHTWTLEIISTSVSDLGGYKEVIARLSGQSVYSRLKFESGAHRVQRIPQTETQGRIHTSACTVAVIPEAKEIDQVIPPPHELRIDTYRASGAGGQHVNRTDSAVRITHIPTGIVAECQDGRSQHKNKAQAMSVLIARLLDRERSQKMREEAAHRKSLIGSGDRSERIRTYNFPQGRVTDHRIGLTLYKLDTFMDGDIDEMLDALYAKHQAEQLEKWHGTSD